MLFTSHRRNECSARPSFIYPGKLDQDKKYLHYLPFLKNIHGPLKGPLDILPVNLN